MALRTAARTPSIPIGLWITPAPIPRARSSTDLSTNAVARMVGGSRWPYGFIAAKDGSETYFHRNSVRHRAFDRLQIRSKVRFVEEMGEKGPQASTVTLHGT
jgi:cold shock CspA family protein